MWKVLGADGITSSLAESAAVKGKLGINAAGPRRRDGKFGNVGCAKPGARCTEMLFSAHRAAGGKTALLPWPACG